MLSGALPVPEGAVAGSEAALRAGVELQLQAGIDLVTDGGAGWRGGDAALLEALEAGDTGAHGLLVRSWRATSGLAPDASVAAVIPGPYSLAVQMGDVNGATSLAQRLHDELIALADAGCELVVAEEPEATGIGDDEARRRTFREAQARLLGDDPPLHAMLSITGGSAWDAGAETIVEAPYRSYLFDVIAGPDNWYLARSVPGDRGVVCAALKGVTGEDEAPLLVWAARYAASMDGRGLERVGLANSGSLAALSFEDAAEAAERLVRAAQLAAMDPEDAVAAGLDRRTFAQPPGRGARPRTLRTP
jgi:hypothetical protein